METQSVDGSHSDSDDSLMQDITNVPPDDGRSEVSDSSSYTSDTPLVKDTANEISGEMTFDNNVTKDPPSNININDQMERIPLTTVEYSRQVSVNTEHSVVDINDFLEGCEEIEVEVRPLNIIGAGWECGSVSSLYHLAASKDGFRHRLGTSDKQSTHGSNALLPQNRLLSRVFANSISSFQFSKKGSIIDDLHKSVIPDKDETEHGDQNDIDSESTKPRNFKNLCVVSIGLTILYFAIGGLRNLQSSLNSDGGVGVISLAATFASFTVSSLTSPFLVQMYRPKRCLVAGFTSHIFYVMANYCPKLVYFIPSSVILGFGNALTWNAACTYITELGINEADWKKKFPSHVLSRYFGFFFLTYQASTVFGNLISSLILVPKVPNSDQSYNIVFNNNITEYFNGNTTDVLGTSTIALSKSLKYVCGAGFSSTNSSESAILSVDEFDKLFLLGTYATCVIIAILTIVVFLDNLPKYSSKSSSVEEVLVQARDVVSMTLDKKFIFIVVLCLYTVIGNGFVIADTLRAYVTCPIGIYMVGYTMICFGICGSLSSITFGKLQRYIGRVPIFLLATLINVVSLVVMVTWHPTADDIYYIFVLLGAWGFADGIWQSQTISLISSVFTSQYENALGCCRFLQGIAGIVVFLLSDTLGMRTKITFVLGTCLLAFIFYMIMEVTLKCTKRDQEYVQDKRKNEIDVSI